MKRREQRECIFQLLFRVEFNGQEEMPRQAELFLENMKEEYEPGEQDESYILEKYKKVVEMLPEIDLLLEGAARGWKLSRIGKVELTILRLAVYEMRFDEDIPEKVAINEAVELSKKFGGDEHRHLSTECWRSLRRSREDGKECIHRPAGQCIYQKYVCAGLYAEPDLCKGRNFQL